MSKKRPSRGDVLIEKSLYSPSSANEKERLTFACFIALIIHAIIIFGVSFSVHSRNKISPSLEVTLSQQNDEQAPQDADYLAQSHQEGSGTLEKKTEITTDQQPDVSTPDQPLAAQTRPNLKTNTAFVENPLISTTNLSTNQSQSERKKDQEIPADQKEEITEIHSEIASLQAKLAEQRQQYAKRPRIRTLTSVSTRASADAEYLAQWQEKIELIGNLNYPKQARTRKLYGQLRLLVSLLPDGSVHEIQVLESSSQPILDQAAIRIVHLAAPFAPFTPAMKKNTDRLEIIRTWKFEKGDRLSNQ